MLFPQWTVEKGVDCCALFQWSFTRIPLSHMYDKGILRLNYSSFNPDGVPTAAFLLVNRSSIINCMKAMLTNSS